MSERITEVIATRELKILGPEPGQVTIRLGMPQQLQDGDWCCSFEIDGLGGESVEHAYGVDAVQALCLALEGIRVALERVEAALEWVGGEGAGIPRFVPSFLPRDAAERISSEIDRELVHWASEAERRGRRG